VTFHSTPEAAELADVTFRQIDYWARHRIVTPTIEADGSGSRRRWSDGDVRALAAVGRAARATRHEAIAEMLRQVGESARRSGFVSVDLGEDVTLLVHPRLDTHLASDVTTDDACPDDTDGMHSIGCGCDTSDVFA
jgi:DNA-binding transcriptional MerR regulator